MKNSQSDRVFQKKLGASVWYAITHNFWYKLLSIAIAVFIWSYVITANPSITRPKSLGDMDVILSGQSALANRGFALLNDFEAEPPTAKVSVSVPQANFNAVSVDNVRVELDLSTIRRTGKQVVKLRGTSVYGTVAQITPESIEVEVEKLDQRNVLVNVLLSDDKDEDQYWYNIASKNPSIITVTGPASLVQRASSAQVYLDLNGRTESHFRTELVTIVDAQGQELPASLSKSASSVSVSLDIYPVKLLPVSADIDEVLIGELPAGYEFVGDVEVQPTHIRVAADQALLDSLTSVAILPVDVSGATRSFNRNTSVNKLADVKKYSSENVNVKVDIIEKNADKTFSNVPATLINLNPNLKAKWSNPKLVVKVTGQYSIIQGLSRADLLATVDLSEITVPGSYDLPFKVSIDNYPELGYSSSPAVARVTITAQ